MVVRIPCGVLHGMKCIGTEPAILINTVTEPYDPQNPDEFRVHPHDNDIPYDWAAKDG
jgi:dTDP-4-dehydrorhamnose 3,5-epimerase